MADFDTFEFDLVLSQVVRHLNYLHCHTKKTKLTKNINIFIFLFLSNSSRRILTELRRNMTVLAFARQTMKYVKLLH